MPWPTVERGAKMLSTAGEEAERQTDRKKNQLQSPLLSPNPWDGRGAGQ